MSIIAVFGSTGQQGGAVVRSLSRNGQFSIRAVTRNLNSDGAKKLATLKNVTIVEGDLDNAASVEKVLKDCYGAFLVTDSRLARGDLEVKQGINFCDAAVKNNLKHIIFSGLEACEPVIKRPCAHFDFKTKVEDYALKLKDKIIFTSVRMPCYYESIKMFLKKNEDGSYVLNMPMENKKMFSMCIEDCGDCVSSIFQNSEKFKSKLVGLSAENLTQTEYLDIINKHLAPIIVKDGKLTLKQFLEINKFPAAQDYVDMFEFYQSQKMERDIELTKSLNKNLLSFDSWLKNNKEFFLAQK
jgi:hypothetical protein